MLNLSAIVKKLRAVAYALDNVEIKGRQNLDILLGSIQNIERVAADLESGLREMEPKTNKEPEINLEIVPDNSEDDLK